MTGPNEEIRALASVIREKFHPEKIVLFGSYAYGTPTKDSDVDLLVIMDTKLPLRKQAYLIRRELKRTIPIDVIVRTPEQVARRIEMGDFFMRRVISQGIGL